MSWIWLSVNTSLVSDRETVKAIRNDKEKVKAIRGVSNNTWHSTV